MDVNVRLAGMNPHSDNADVVRLWSQEMGGLTARTRSALAKRSVRGIAAVRGLWERVLGAWVPSIARDMHSWQDWQPWWLLLSPWSVLVSEESACIIIGQSAGMARSAAAIAIAAVSLAAM